MHTNEKLSKLSDLEINKLVNLICEPKMIQSIIDYIPKYCTDPSLIMPLAHENEIGHQCCNSEIKLWEAFDYSSAFESTGTSPLRAICEVFILMSQEQE